MAITQEQLILVVGIIAAGSVLLQVFLAVTSYCAIRIANREREELEKKIYGLVKRMEGLTSSSREQVVGHYDAMIERLSTQLPHAVAERASDLIFDAESKILNRLAELEPDLRRDTDSRHKMDELIRTMESLEQTVTSTTAEAVRKVMHDSRNQILVDEILPSPTC